MKRITAIFLVLLMSLSAISCVSVVAKEYNFTDNEIIIILTDEATEKVRSGELVIDMDYFAQYNIGVIKVEELHNQRDINLNNFYYFLTLNKHDYENVLKVVEILKNDSNFEFVGPNCFANLDEKLNNPMEVTTKTRSVKYKNVKKAKQTVSPITVKKAKGKVTYKKLSGSKKLLLKANGKIVVKKGTKKGIYTAKIKVTAKGNSKYKSKSKTVKIKIKVR